MATTLERAERLSEDRDALRRRLLMARAVLAVPIRQEFRSPVFDFANRRMVSTDGRYALQWRVRVRPDLPESYDNQQTSVGVVVLRDYGAPGKATVSRNPGEDNPKRPPKKWWDMMVRKIRHEYPGRTKEAISEIVGGIWYHNYSKGAKRSVTMASENPKTKTISGKQITSNLMNEVIMHGGIPMRRVDVYKEVMETTSNQRAADSFAFGLHKKTVDLEPWSLEDARKLFRDGLWRTENPLDMSGTYIPDVPGSTTLEKAKNAYEMWMRHGQTESHPAYRLYITYQNSLSAADAKELKRALSGIKAKVEREWAAENPRKGHAQRRFDPATAAGIDVARRTLNTPDAIADYLAAVSHAPTKEQAREILREHGIRVKENPKKTSRAQVPHGGIRIPGSNVEIGDVVEYDIPGSRDNMHVLGVVIGIIRRGKMPDEYNVMYPSPYIRSKPGYAMLLPSWPVKIHGKLMENQSKFQELTNLTHNYLWLFQSNRSAGRKSEDAALREFAPERFIPVSRNPTGHCPHCGASFPIHGGRIQCPRCYMPLKLPRGMKVRRVKFGENPFKSSDLKGSHPQGHFYPTREEAEADAARYRASGFRVSVIRHDAGNGKSYYSLLGRSMNPVGNPAGKTETPVIFRKFQGDIIALLPTIPGSSAFDCMSYEHVGQHGGANPNMVMRMSKPAKPSEYADLLAEMKQVGYDDLKVYNRLQYWFLDARRENLKKTTENPIGSSRAGRITRGSRTCTHVVITADNRYTQCDKPTLPGRLYCAEHAPLHAKGSSRSKNISVKGSGMRNPNSAAESIARSVFIDAGTKYPGKTVEYGMLGSTAYRISKTKFGYYVLFARRMGPEYFRRAITVESHSKTLPSLDAAREWVKSTVRVIGNPVEAANPQMMREEGPVKCKYCGKPTLSVTGVHPKCAKKYWNRPEDFSTGFNDPTFVKSKGHIGLFQYNGTWYEVFKDGLGELFRAPVSNVIDIGTGYRLARWEAPAWQADEQAKILLGKQ